MTDTPTNRPLSDRGTSRDDRKMPEKQQNIQDAFLNSARRDKTLLTIYLTGGMKLTGRIRSFDKYSVVVESNNQEQLVFKHAISTISASRPSFARAQAPAVGVAVGANSPSEPPRPPRLNESGAKQPPEG